MVRSRMAAWAVVVAAVLGNVSGALGADPQYKTLKEIAIGQIGDWGHITADAEGRRLYVPNGTKVVVIDTAQDQVIGEIPNLPGVHRFAVAADLQRGFSSNGKANTVSVIDLAAKDGGGKPTFKEIMRIKTGGDPDGILYDAKSGEVWTCNAQANTFTAFDAKTGKVLADAVALGGKPNTGLFDPDANRAYINLVDKDALAVVDLKAHKVLTQWPMGADNRQPMGIALDRESHRLFVACLNARLVMMDATNGKVLATLHMGSEVEGVAFDPGTHLALAASMGGTVMVAKAEGDKLTEVQTFATDQTRRGARGLALDTKTHKLYLENASGGPDLRVLVYGTE